MNMLPILLGFFAYQMVNKNKSSSKGLDLTSLLSNPESIGLLSTLGKLNGRGDKNQVLMELVSNPAIMGLIGQVLNGTNSSQTTEAPTVEATTVPTPEPTMQTSSVNDTFSTEAQDFFKPVENVAGVNISEKLYSLYDNWYIKK